MKLKNLFLLSVIVTLSLAFAACDDGEKKTEPCGNGVLDPGEECDGTNLNSETCATVMTSKPSGTLTCSATCSFDTSACTAPECGNDIREGSEVCDGEDLGGQTCAALPDFKGGTLACTEACILDTSACEIDCRNDNFEDCNPMGGNTECCPHNDMPSVCFTGFGDGFCMQTCSAHTDCGWSMECSSRVSNNCYVTFCGSNPNLQSTDIQEPCTLPNGRPGSCYPIWRAMDQGGQCIEDGTLEHGQVCPLADVMGELDVDPATQCGGSFCFGRTGDTEGHCFGKCNPITTYNTLTDTCPPNSACVNYSSLDDDETSENYLFREPDLGVCYIMEGEDTFSTCDMITGTVIRGTGEGTPCPAGQTCQLLLGWGSLIGYCGDVQETPLAVGDECVGNTELPEECGAGAMCMYDDPLNAATKSCLRFCKAPANGALNNATANAACEDLLDGDGNPYVCMTVSRFFTADGLLPSTGTGTQTETETMPSPLGFCMPLSATTVNN